MPKMTEAFVIREDSRPNIKKLLKLPQPLADEFHKIDAKFSFPLAKGFILWLASHDDNDEPSKESIEPYMAELGGALLDAAKAKPNVVPGEVNKAKSSDDITAIIAKHGKKTTAPEDSKKILMKFPDGSYWYKLDQSEHGDEGKQMQHCATDNRGDLVSLRDRKGEPHVTMTYNRAKNTVYQIKGKQNREPEERYWPPIEAFFKNFGAKLRDTLSKDLSARLTGHERTSDQPIAEGKTGVWFEGPGGDANNNVYVLVAKGGKASDHPSMRVRVPESTYDQMIRSIEAPGDLTLSKGLVELIALMDALGPAYIDVGLSQASAGRGAKHTEIQWAEDLEGDPTADKIVTQLLASKKLRVGGRELKQVAGVGPVVVNVSIDGKRKRMIFSSPSAVFLMKPAGQLEGELSHDGFLVDAIVPAPDSGSVEDLSAVDGPMLTKALEAGGIYGIRHDATVDNRPMSETLPQTWEELRLLDPEG